MQHKWTKIEDGLPPLEEKYTGGPKEWRGLIWTGYRVKEGKLEETYVKRKLTWKDAGNYCVDAKAWMPFPEPPNA